MFDERRFYCIRMPTHYETNSFIAIHSGVPLLPLYFISISMISAASYHFVTSTLFGRLIKRHSLHFGVGLHRSPVYDTTGILYFLQIGLDLSNGVMNSM